MDFANLPFQSDLDTGFDNLEQAGLEFSVVCAGPEPACPSWSIPQAA